MSDADRNEAMRETEGENQYFPAQLDLSVRAMLLQRGLKVDREGKSERGGQKMTLRRVKGSVERETR